MSEKDSLDTAIELVTALDHAGYAIVPREPTEAMQDAGAYPRENRKPVAEIWRAMVGAVR
jgi:hypothetical protein